ncbi:MAG: glycosyltransferase family 2 protein [Saprospiraceae bacterium]|nr:glycosyltransferase family 2 protein [Candidatus Defluviibacterium haderslevense]
MNHKFTIIIPTKDRCETLYWAIKSCLQNNYPNFFIIVSDNASSDKTEEVVRGFGDQRISYLRTPTRLSMTSNWEFALSHVVDGFVSILGDDDGFLPNSFKDINEMLQQYNLKAISWSQSFYRWPGNDFVKIKNILQIPYKVGYEIRSTIDTIKSVINQQKFPGDLPWLYGGFINMDCINEVKSKSGGLFFHSKIPDIYSSMVLSSILDEYIFSYTPFSIAGHSAKSNGSAQIQKNANEILSNSVFLQESEDFPWHSKLEFVHVYPIIIWESILQAKDVGIFRNSLDIDYQELLDKGIRHCIQLDIIELESAKLKSIASKNGLIFKNIRVFNKIQSVIFKIKHYLYVWSRNAFYSCLDYNVTNVYEASILQAKLVRPLWIIIIIKNLKLLIKNI